MPLQTPNLDDRSFEQLVEQALELVQKNLNADWNDLSPGDPGIVLLEAFAFLTEQMIYRLNRLPEKAYIAFLRLLGVSLYPPTAARTTLEFSHDGQVDAPIKIPYNTQVTTSSATDLDEAPIFATTFDVTVEPGETAVVEAYHCNFADGERIGIGTGAPGLTLQVQRPPIVAAMKSGETTKNNLNLVVGVEIDPAEQTPADWEGGPNKDKVFRIWKEVDNFADLSGKENKLVYVVDRQSGLIQFAPAARLTQKSENGRQLTQAINSLAAVPEGGREIRAWYPYGGGESGNNIPPGTLDRIIDGSPNITVTNTKMTRGGLDAEVLDNALIRGPQEVYALERAVTAEDYERLAVSTKPEIARAYAYPKHWLWKYAPPGTVEIVLVPRLASVQPEAITAVFLHEHQQFTTIQELPQELAQRSTIGTRILAKWAQYKKVTVRAQLVLDGNEDEDLVQARVKKRLHRFISPLSQPEDASHGQSAALVTQERILRTGWPFGQSLQVADVYRLILANEPRIARISSLELSLESAPNRNVHCLAADTIQPHTWYAASDNRVFRSTNNGDGWELVGTFAPGGFVFIKTDDIQSPWRLEDVGRDETVRHIVPSPDQAGFVALATETSDAEGNLRSPLYLSIDSGARWFNINGDIDSQIHDMVWLMRGNQHVLLLATSKGLFEVEIVLIEGVPDYRRESFHHVLKSVLPNNAAYPLYALAVLRGQRGNIRLAVATQRRRGVYLSNGADLTGFSEIGGRGEDIRHLNVQSSRNNLFLWAGVMARADNGRGCLRWQIDSKRMALSDPAGRWISQHWTGGSCYAVAFLNNRVFAVTAWGGVLTLDYNPNRPDAALTWTAVPREDLPLRQYELADRLGEDEPGSHQEDHQTAVHTDLHPFLPLITIATNDQSPEKQQDIVMVGGAQGIERSEDGGAHYDHGSRQVFKQLKDAVTIPNNWLLVSDDHDITSTKARGTT